MYILDPHFPNRHKRLSRQCCCCCCCYHNSRLESVFFCPLVLLLVHPVARLGPTNPMARVCVCVSKKEIRLLFFPSRPSSRVPTPDFVCLGTRTNPIPFHFLWNPISQQSRTVQLSYDRTRTDKRQITPDTKVCCQVVQEEKSSCQVKKI